MHIGETHISTVFLMIDHGYAGYLSVPPILFETMVFGGEYDDWCNRYCTWDEAQAGHQAGSGKPNRT